MEGIKAACEVLLEHPESGADLEEQWVGNSSMDPRQCRDQRWAVVNTVMNFGFLVVQHIKRGCIWLQQVFRDVTLDYWLPTFLRNVGNH
jgi:hypothetical protein